MIDGTEKHSVDAPKVPLYTGSVCRAREFELWLYSNVLR